MEFKSYKWDECPEVYKAAAPFTKYFFEAGGTVELVMALTIGGPIYVEDFHNTLAEASKKIGMDHYTDMVEMETKEKEMVMLFFWAKD